MADLKSTLTARYNYWNDLVLDKNLEGLMNMYEDDCMLSLFHQKPIFGKQAVTETFREAITTSRIKRMHFDVIQVEEISPDMAFTSSLMYSVDSDGKRDKLIQKDFVVWKKGSGQYRIFQDICSVCQ